MALSTLEQVKAMVECSGSIVLLFPSQGQGRLDALDRAAGSLVLAQTLESMGKTVTVVSPDFLPHKSFAVLPGTDTIKTELPPLQRLVVRIPYGTYGTPTLTQTAHGDELLITVTPATGIIPADRVRVHRTTANADLIITLGASDLETLEPILEHHAEFLHTTPILVIDHGTANEGYGTLNWIQPTASSVSESVATLLERWNPEFITSVRATMLLAGIMGATRSFRSGRIHPAGLDTTRRLLERGAEREEVMTHLFRGRSIGTVKLWGRALSHMRHYPEGNFVTTTITRHDFDDTQGSEEELQEVVEELILASPESEVALLLYETRDQTLCGILFSKKIPPQELLGNVEKPRTLGNRALRFCITHTGLMEAEQALSKEILKRLA